LTPELFVISISFRPSLCPFADEQIAHQSLNHHRFKLTRRRFIKRAANRIPPGPHLRDRWLLKLSTPAE
jgi:hypothetical protein